MSGTIALFRFLICSYGARGEIITMTGKIERIKLQSLAERPSQAGRHGASRQEIISHFVQGGLKLLAFDLDGTLLNQRGHISGENRKALEEAKHLGIDITLITGRHISKVRHLAEELKLKVPFVTSNGCEIWSPDGELLQRSTLAHEERAWIHQWAQHHSLGYRAYCVDGVFDWSSAERNEFEAASSGYVTHEWLKVLVSHTGKEDNPNDAAAVVSTSATLAAADAGRGEQQPRCISGLYEQLAADARFALAAYSTDPAQVHRIDVHPAGVDKAAGLQAVCRHIGVTAAQVAAFGDDTNDIAMLRWAQLGVAMEHAPAAVIEAANIIAPHHNRDGAAIVVRELLSQLS
jgi:HAD superfamily hydrolase (TIGR01484 family)